MANVQIDQNRIDSFFKSARAAYSTMKKKASMYNSEQDGIYQAYHDENIVPDDINRVFTNAPIPENDPEYEDSIIIPADEYSKLYKELDEKYYSGYLSLISSLKSEAGYVQSVSKFLEEQGYTSGAGYIEAMLDKIINPLSLEEEQDEYMRLAQIRIGGGGIMMHLLSNLNMKQVQNALEENLRNYLTSI